MVLDEGKLVLLAIEGDLGAFEELYKINREKIFRLIYGFVKNSADAEDLLQEVFSRAFLAIKRFNPRKGSVFSTWLCRIGINCSISFLRKSRGQQKRERQIIFHGSGSVVEARNCNPESLAEIEEIENIFKKGLDTLSYKQRTIVVLRYYNGFKIKDIAEKMQCSEGSVKRQLFRGFSKPARRTKSASSFSRVWRSMKSRSGCMPFLNAVF